MQYLPYVEEQTWQHQIYPNGYNGYYMEPQGLTTWPNELPLSYGLWERFWTNVDNGNYGRAAWDIALLLPTMITDAAWWAINTAVNGYKRLYNDAAALYNNAAAQYESWRTPTVTPQTSLTWRKIPSTMVVPQAPVVVQTEIPQPEKYLYWNGKIQAKIIEPPVYQYSTGAPTFTTIWQRGKGWTTGQLNRLQNLYNRAKNYGAL